MSAEKLEVDVSHEMCLRCTVVNESSDQDIYSSEIQYQGAGWKLRYFKWGTYYYLSLRKCSGVSTNPFQVSVHVESVQDGRIVNVLLEERRFTTQFEEEDFGYLIWWKREHEILGSIPEFRLHRVLKLIVVLKAEDGDCTCATCKFTATDDKVPSLESFSKDLGDVLDQDASTDVEFRFADTDDNTLTTVRAHKFLVCARSPVLAAMLHSDMVEGRTGVATVRDIDVGVFKQFLKYLYSGKLDELTADTAMSLYEAGDRFQVKGMTKHCAKWMARNLTIENSCQVLLLADAHADEEFVEATITFMANREVPQVFDGWKDFRSKHPELSNRVLDRFGEMLKTKSTEGEYSCSKRRRIV